MDFKHRQHYDQCDLVEEVAKQEKDDLQACQGNTEESLDAAIAKCKDTMQEVEARKKNVDSVITNSLEQACKALLAQNEKIRQSKITGLETQMHQLRRVRDGLSLAFSMIAEAQSYTLLLSCYLQRKSYIAERGTRLQEDFKHSNLLLSQSDYFVTDISDPPLLAR